MSGVSTWIPCRAASSPPCAGSPASCTRYSASSELPGGPRPPAAMACISTSGSSHGGALPSCGGLRTPSPARSNAARRTTSRLPGGARTGTPPCCSSTTTRTPATTPSPVPTRCAACRRRPYPPPSPGTRSTRSTHASSPSPPCPPASPSSATCTRASMTLPIRWTPCWNGQNATESEPGSRLVDRYLEFVAGRCRPNTLLMCLVHGIHDRPAGDLSRGVRGRDSAGLGGCPGMLPGGGVDSGGDPWPGDAGYVGVGGAGERVELQEVPGDGEPEDAADDQRCAQAGILAAHGATQVGDPLVQERAHRGCCLWCGEHGPHESLGLRGQGPEPDVQDVVQMGLNLVRSGFPQLDGDGEEGGLRSVVLHDQGRVHVRALGDAADGGCLQAALPELRTRRVQDPLGGGCAPRGSASRLTHTIHSTVVERIVFGWLNKR